MLLNVTASPAAAAPAVAGLDCGTAAGYYDRLPQQGAGTDFQLGQATGCLINIERARAGLRPLTGIAQLVTAAAQHADASVALKWWGPGKDPHTNPQTQSTPGSRITAAGYCPNPRSWKYGEITYNGWGSPSTPRAAVAWWMNSPGHRAIILDPSLTDLGPAERAGAADPAGSGARNAGTYVVDFGTCQQ